MFIGPVFCIEESFPRTRESSLGLADAHAALDNAVARAYAWKIDISEDETLKKLLAMNEVENIA